MSQALYRKYRSRNLDELVGQDHIVRALKSSIANGKISHAYLLTGPRGTGKTSVARILAYALNGIDYDENASQLDIIEIDAASNRRIDEIRDLREKVHIAPTSLRYKVYIIDEVHMLTREAFNALLKTLEEPPEHAIFILATTELHKVPDTIISRTQRYSFKPIEKSKIVEHLSSIAKSEKLDASNEALELIAEHADGGFRDAISLLDQVRHISEKITADSVMDALGAPPKEMVDTVWQSLQDQHQPAKHLQTLYDSGYHAPQIAKLLLARAITASKTDLAHKLMTVQSSFDPKIELLLVALEYSNTESESSTSHNARPKLADTAPIPPVTPQKTESTPQRSEIKKRVKNSDQPTAINSNNDDWEKILARIKEGGHSVYGPLRLAQASISDGVVKLGLAFPFHIKRVNEDTNLRTLHEAVNEITGSEHVIVVERINRAEDEGAKPAEKSILPAVRQPDAELMSDPLSIVKNVFGGAEVL